MQPHSVDGEEGAAEGLLINFVARGVAKNKPFYIRALRVSPFVERASRDELVSEG